MIAAPEAHAWPVLLRPDLRHQLAPSAHAHLIPRTGKEIRLTAFAMWRIADGKIVEHWHVTDQLSLLQQLGVVKA